MESLICIGTTYGVRAGKSICFLTRSTYIGSLVTGDTANLEVTVSIPSGQMGTSLEFYRRLGEVVAVALDEEEATLRSLRVDTIGNDASCKVTPVTYNIFAQIGYIKLQRTATHQFTLDGAVAMGSKLRYSALLHLYGERVSLVVTVVALRLQCTARHHQFRRRAYAHLGHIGGTQVERTSTEDGLTRIFEEIGCTDGELPLTIENEVTLTLKRAIHCHRIAHFGYIELRRLINFC